MTERWQDYVYNLATAVRALAPEAYDSHLFALEVRPHILCFCQIFSASASYWALSELQVLLLTSSAPLPACHVMSAAIRTGRLRIQALLRRHQLLGAQATSPGVA